MMTYTARSRNKFLILIHKDINVFDFPRHTQLSLHECSISFKSYIFSPILRLLNCYNRWDKNSIIGKIEVIGCLEWEFFVISQRHFSNFYWTTAEVVPITNNLSSDWRELKNHGKYLQRNLTRVISWCLSICVAIYNASWFFFLCNYCNWRSSAMSCRK